jgi:predicted phage terminase large subunit-like protein
MTQQIAPAVLLDLIAKERKRRAAENDLMEFTRQSFHIIEPGQEFRENWHLNVIAEHLMAVSHGECKNLVINIPPGCMKSIMACVSWPAWAWAKNQTLRFLSASYGEDLAIRDAAKTKDILVSEWYTKRWPNVQIRMGSDQKKKYELTGGGWRLATSVGGRATGEHPDFKVVDDPHNARQAESEAEREAALSWFDRTLSTRGQSRDAATVVIMQRLHEKDITGHILADIGGYEHLCIPMEYDCVPRKTFMGKYDPRTERDQLLWPEMFSAQKIKDLKVLLGSFGSSGQLQQDPTPTGGGILKTEHLQMWPAGVRKPQLEFVLQSYDCAFTEKTTGDPTACTVWGVFTHMGKHNLLLLDAWDEHLGYPDLRQRAIDDWAAEYGADNTTGEGTPVKGRRPDRVLIEAKASGQSLIQDLRLARVPVISYNPGNADKISRAHQAAPILEQDLIWIPESTKTPGHMISWAQPMIKQLTKFPVAEHDDYVDTVTQALIWLKDAGWFEMPKAAEVYDDDDDFKSVDNRNPYAI